MLQYFTQELKNLTKTQNMTKTSKIAIDIYDQ